MKKLWALCFIMGMLLALGGCGGESLAMPTYGEVESITVQELEGEQAVSREVSLADTVSYWKSSQPELCFLSGEGFRRVRKESQLPSKENSILCRMELTDGSVRAFRVYSDDKYDYIEEPDLGVWRAKRISGIVSLYASTFDTYERLSFYQAYAQFAEQKSFTLLPEYNGAGKAMWLEMEDGVVDDWYDRYIPDGLEAKRAEDVRYIVLQETISKEYKGYWYVPETGQKLDDAYDRLYRTSVYDLVSGEVTVLIEETGDVFAGGELIEAFFAA